jgi:hypothetical protein
VLEQHVVETLLSSIVICRIHLPHPVIVERLETRLEREALEGAIGSNLLDGGAHVRQ